MPMPVKRARRAKKARPWHVSCLLILARIEQQSSELMMFTLETTAIALSGMAQKAMSGGSYGHLFTTMKHDSTVKNTNKSNVSHF
jgi:hypothetical protein